MADPSKHELLPTSVGPNATKDQGKSVLIRVIAAPGNFMRKTGTIKLLGMVVAQCFILILAFMAGFLLAGNIMEPISSAVPTAEAGLAMEAIQAGVVLREPAEQYRFNMTIPLRGDVGVDGTLIMYDIERIICFKAKMDALLPDEDSGKPNQRTTGRRRVVITLDAGRVAQLDRIMLKDLKQRLEVIKAKVIDYVAGRRFVDIILQCFLDKKDITIKVTEGVQDLQQGG